MFYAYKTSVTSEWLLYIICVPTTIHIIKIPVICINH